MVSRVVIWRIENNNIYVCFNGTDSGFLPITCGVPQGSILGSSLFLLYVNELCNLSTRLTSILFADDTSFFLKVLICQTCVFSSKLPWSDHVSYIRHKMSKNLSVMHRVKWLLNNSALYMIYCYCCEIWGNMYKSRLFVYAIILNIDRTLNLLS